MSFLKDTNARVPFAVIGIFLIIISTLISLNIARLDINMAKAISSGGEIAAPDTTLQYARADIARAINYAGLEALKTLGEMPVIVPDNNSVYFEGTGGDPAEFNKNRAKAMIQDTLDIYIESNYMNNTFVNNEISINIDNVGSWKAITIEPVRMRLEDRFEPPLFKPGEGKYQKGYETYYKVAVPLRIHVRNLKTRTEVMDQNITIETIITSRYPLLKDLTTEYGERLNGTNAVMTETTAFAMAYTWGRGYLQYYKNAPLNIVDNTHLALIMNGALLLDQGYVFKSADPMSVAEYAKQTALTLSGKSTDYRNISLDNGSLKIDPQQDAFNSTNDSERAKAEYYNATKFDYNATPIMNYLNNESRPGGSIVYNKIWEIIPQVYSAKLATGIARQTSETAGAHDGYESSHSIDPWGEPDSMRFIRPIPGDAFVPGNLYGEIWEAAWTRSHVWRHYYTVYYSCTKTEYYSCPGSNGKPSTCSRQVPSTCSRTEYNEMTTTDTRVDTVSLTLKALENSKTSIQLDYSGGFLASMNDVNKAFTPQDVEYENAHTDRGLTDAYELYKSNIFDPDLVDNIKSQNLNGIYKERWYSSSALNPYHIDAPMWLDLETKMAVKEITRAITNDVHLDPNINYMTYPIPSDLLNAARIDLIKKIEANETRYIDRVRYKAGLYSSTSAKVISLAREWYVDEVKHQINVTFINASSQINREIQKNFTKNITDANKNATKFLSEGMNLPIGLAMSAYHVDVAGNKYPVDNISAWNESVTLSINQEPDYLDPENVFGEEKLYTLKIRNANPTNPLQAFYGIPVLPTLEPWILTFGAWEINVEGEFVKFEVQDIDNEVHPDPIFGHAAQVYVREADTIFDTVNNNIPIGDNLPLTFKFTTGTFIAVPPGKLGVGDREGGLRTALGYVEESKGWKIK